jgi:hypothetical protein
MLQLDLESAFQSIDRTKFLAFARALAPNSIAAKLLQLLLESFGLDVKGVKGVPLINDSLFFLGNAYLHVVDGVIQRHSKDFVRFVDDYRIFGESQAHLEALLSRVSLELEGMGFRINMNKVKLGSSGEYLDAVAKGAYAKTDDSSRYVSAAVFSDVVEPKQMVDLVARVVREPDKYLNEGFGRLVLGAIRRMRLNHEVALQQNYPDSPRTAFAEQLSSNDELVSATLSLLERYLSTNDEDWRSVWLLYVMEDINITPSLTSRFNDLVKEFQKKATGPQLAGLWARKLWPAKQTKTEVKIEELEELHELGYIETGLRLFG